MERVCSKCKLFNAKLEFNCSILKIIIPDMNMAKKCKFFDSNVKKKRCGKCEYITYKLVKRKYLYVCSKTNKITNYSMLRHCNLFKRKVTEKIK